MLLDAVYNIFAKVLENKMQPLLMKVVDIHSFAFLLLRYILDNAFLARETSNEHRTPKSIIFSSSWILPRLTTKWCGDFFLSHG